MSQFTNRQAGGDDRREIEAEQTSMEPEKIAEGLKALIWPNMAPANKALLQAAIHALLSPPPATVYCLPPPITEADGYRLNTSWHSGAIFRDGANWMRGQMLLLKAEAMHKPQASSGRNMPPHEFSQMVNELRDVDSSQSRRAKIVGVLHAFNIKPRKPE